MLHLLRLAPLPFLLVSLATGCTEAPAEQDDSSQGPGTADTAADSGSPQTQFEPTFDIIEFFDMEALRKPDGINLQVKKDVIKKQDDLPVWLVPFAFRSQVWHGNAWDHPSTLYLPEKLNPAYAGTVAIVQQGTDDLDPGLNVESELGAKTAAALGIPVVILAKVPHPTMFSAAEDEKLSAKFPSCFGRTYVENILESCATTLSLDSGTFKWSLQLPIARAYIRAVTALELLPAKLASLEIAGLPELTFSKAVVGGAGKRGRSLWMAAAVDARIAGVWVAAADMANLVPFFDNMLVVWTGSYPFGDPAKQMAFLSKGFGLHWRSLTDPWAYLGHLDGRHVMLLAGTNDPLYPLGSYHLYSERLPKGWSLVHVASYGHGMASQDHVTAWRAFVARVAGGRPALSPEMVLHEEGGVVAVKAILRGDPAHALTPVTVHVHHTDGQSVSEDKDLRDARWASTPLSPAGTDADGSPRYQGAFPVVGVSWAAYVTVREQDGSGLPGIASSPVHLSWE